jgi:hypothetical protein
MASFEMEKRVKDLATYSTSGRWVRFVESIIHEQLCVFPPTQPRMGACDLGPTRTRVSFFNLVTGRSVGARSEYQQP